MLGVWGAGGLGFFFLLEPSPGAPLTSPKWGFFFLVLRDSELFVPGGGGKEGDGGVGEQLGQQEPLPKQRGSPRITHPDLGKCTPKYSPPPREGERQDVPAQQIL